jgi:ATP-dependent DNA ligase
MKRKPAQAGEPAPQVEEAPFPEIDLSIKPPFPPMEARPASTLPAGSQWIYEPKFDGFRGLAFRKGNTLLLQSKAGQPLGRYFPELVEALLRLPQKQFVLDGEIVIIRDGILDFNSLLMRIHPAASRIAKLAKETPVSFLAFDLLVDARGKRIDTLPLVERKRSLQDFMAKVPAESLVRSSPFTTDRSQAQHWMQSLAGSGFDGVVAKLAGEPYHSGNRAGMVKVKRIRTADCVVGGFRYAAKEGPHGPQLGSLLLGLYDETGRLNHVGFSASFTAEKRAELLKILLPLVRPSADAGKKDVGFSGNAPGGPSRWATERSTEWQALKNKLVCEVQYDHFSGGRFRHGTKFLRWRPDKAPRQCTYEQVLSPAGGDIGKLLAAA